MTIINKKIELALVDDHPIVREGLKAIFQKHKGRFSLHCFENGEALFSFIQNNQVEIVLLDISLPDYDGVEVCRIIKSNYPDTIVLGFSALLDKDIILQMLSQGASGYIEKSTPSKEIVPFIEDVMDGKLVFSNGISKLLSTISTQPKELPPLTNRERQLLDLLASGKTTAMVASALHLSRYTIDTYRKKLLQKFSAKNTSELLVLLKDRKML